MKKYEDFMKIIVSKYEIRDILCKVGYYEDNLIYPYSKILIQFNSETEFEKLLDDIDSDKIDLNTFTILGEIAGESSFKLYSCDENAFEDICDICSIYDCDIYQFLIINKK